MNYIDLFFNLIIGLIIVWVFWGDKIVNIFKKSITPKPKRRTRRSTASKVADITPEPAVNKTMQNYLKERASLMEGKNLATPVLVTLLLIVFIVICNPIAIVGVGERGVKVTLGQVSPKSYTEGVHLVTPFISKIKKI